MDPLRIAITDDDLFVAAHLNALSSTFPPLRSLRSRSRWPLPAMTSTSLITTAGASSVANSPIAFVQSPRTL